MFRKKGWSKRLEMMTADELRSEECAIRRSLGFVFEREEKLAFIAQQLSPRARPEGMLAYASRPGGVVYLRGVS